MIDYSESLIKLNAMLHQYQKLVLQGKYDAAAEVAVDMQIVAFVVKYGVTEEDLLAQTEALL